MMFEDGTERTGPGTGDGERIIVEYTDPIRDEVYRLVEEINPNPELGIEHDLVTYARPKRGDAWIDRETGHARDLEVLPDES